MPSSPPSRQRKVGVLDMTTDEDTNSNWRVFRDGQIKVWPTLDQLKESLTGGMYLEPATVAVVLTDESEGEIRLRLVIMELRRVPVAAAAVTGQTPVGCYPYPDYQ